MGELPKAARLCMPCGCGAVNQRLKSLNSGKSARYVLWEPGAGDRLRRPGGRRVTGVPTAETALENIEIA
jgi:hypothetical protein